MKVPNTKIEKGIAAKDLGRPVLTHVFLRVVERVTGRGRSRRVHREGFLEATDSYMLARIPVELDEGDVQGLIPAEALVRARKNTKLSTIAANSENVRVGDVTFDRPEGVWPGMLEKTIPDDDKIVVALGINARILMRLAEALGTQGEVRLELSGEAIRTKAGRLQGVRVENHRPIRVQPLSGDGVGVLMPIKLASYPIDEWPKKKV